MYLNPFELQTNGFATLRMSTLLELKADIHARSWMGVTWWILPKGLALPLGRFGERHGITTLTLLYPASHSEHFVMPRNDSV